MAEINQLSYALDTFYLLICGAMVMFMAAGFSMLEAGMVRSKNTVEILTKNVALFAIACIMYLLCGYQIMYPANNAGGIIPSFGIFLGTEHTTSDVISAAESGAYYAQRADFFFQVVFVATATSIVSGAVAERMKLWAFLAFAVVMTGFIYPVQGFWKWGGGFLDKQGFYDFAGSGMVHLAGASAALAGVLLLGPRKGKYRVDGTVNAIPGANLPLAALGALILWFGWFGFNGGSQLKIADFDNANAVAQIFVNTNASAAGGAITALVIARLLFGKADLTMVLNGTLAGLVAITAEPLTTSALGATVIGGIAGVLVVLSIIGLDKLKIDDPVGAISVHGVIGIWGLLAVPLSNEGASFSSQLLGIVIIFLWVFAASLLVWAVIKAIFGIRICDDHEYIGADQAECGIEAYPEFTSKGGRSSI